MVSVRTVIRNKLARGEPLSEYQQKYLSGLEQRNPQVAAREKELTAQLKERVENPRTFSRSGGTTTIYKGEISGGRGFTPTTPQSQNQQQEQFSQQQQTVAQYLARGGSLPGTTTEAQRLQQQQQARNVIAKKYGLNTTAEYVAAGGYLPGTKTQQEALQQQEQATGYLQSLKDKKAQQEQNKQVLKQTPAYTITGVTGEVGNTYTVIPKDIAEQQQAEFNAIGIGTSPYQPNYFVGSGATLTAAKDNIKGDQISDIKEYQKEEYRKREQEESNFIQKVGNKFNWAATDFVEEKADKLNAPIVSDVILPLGLGFTNLVSNVVLHPVETVKGTGYIVLHPVETVTNLQDRGWAMTEEYGEGYSTYYLVGEIAGMYTVAKGTQVLLKNSPVRLETETYKFTTEGGGKVQAQTYGVKVGSKGYTFAARISVDPAIIDLSTGQPINPKVTQSVPFSTDPYAAYRVGTSTTLTYSTRPGALNQPVPFSDLAGSQTQPLTASGGQTVRSGLIDYSPAEITRVESNVRLAYSLGTEKGLPVKEFVINIEGVKNPAAATKIVENLAAENKGIIYGSLTTKQLPGEISGPYSLDYLKDVRSGGTVNLNTYQNIKQGDIDLQFPDLTVEQIKPLIERTAQELQAAGENVRISPTGKGTIIEFVPDTPGGQGEKFLEAKSGINQEAAGLGDEAPAAYLGIKFPNIKAGQSGKTVPFGEAQSITAGEQLQRKGAGATIMSSGLPGETPSFSEPGVLGKQGNPRGLKDTAGFIQGAAGIIKIKESSINPFNKIKAAAGKKQLAQFLESYTPEQQTDILNKLDAITGTEGVKVKLETPGSSPKGKSSPGSPGVLVSDLGFSSAFTSPSPISSSSKLSTTASSPVSPIPSSVSNRSSLLSLSPKDQSTVSYYIGFRSPSDIPKSPYTESPSLITSPPLSISPSPSPRGGSPSPISPSPTPPSPPTSPSPPISPSPSPSPPTSPSPKPGSPSPYSFLPPDEKVPPKVSPFFSFKDDDKKGSYEVLVRRGGLFKRVATKQTAEGAVAFGKFRVETTAAASFKVRPIGSKSIESVNVAARRLLPRSDFYESKKEGLTFIEKRERRIKSQGEKREITALGIFASKTGKTKKKKRFFGGF